MNMKSVKIIFFVCGMLFAFCSEGYSQQRPGQRPLTEFERIESEKVAYISQQLKLHPKEAQRFFPIYNLYRDEITRLIESQRGKERKVNKDEQQFDELAFDHKILDIKKKYRARFEPIIGPARSSRFFEVEREFREKLIKELNSRRGSGGGRDRQPMQFPG
jgi:hypothetical protein